jgi:hypothetical protein
MASVAPRIAREESFYQKMAIGLAVFILFSFGQFAARGMVDYRQAPLIVHVHGAVMVSWLGLLVVQSTLAQRMDLATHRRLGWTGLVLALAIPPLAIATCVTMLRAHAIPPFFSPSFFLALVTTESLIFSGMVLAAIGLRRRTDWHRRLMIGASLILLEPALGRTLPMPLLGPWGQWVSLAVQLIPLSLLVRHDLASRGKIHEATLVVGGVLVASHIIFELLAMAPPVVAIATHLWA